MLHVTWLFIKYFTLALVLMGGILLPLTAIVAIIGLLQGRIDKRPWPDALYMAFITALTVGYGDMTPRKPASKFLSIVLALLGMVVVGIVVAAATSASVMALERSGAIDQFMAWLNLAE